MRQNDTANRF